MKKLLFLMAGVIFIAATSCKKDSDSNIEEKQIEFSKTTLGGCNNEDFSSLKSANVEDADTVKFSTINGDTLNVFVGLNYICCAPFISEAEIRNDTLVMEISDTCTAPYESCYCKCDCYYTWDFKFIEYEEKEYNFVIKLNDPRVGSELIIKQGIIDLSE